jgi:hypothetical protein
LGLSAFHAGFTSVDAMVSSVALGAYKISRGDVLSGLKDIGTFPAAPVTNAMLGHKAQKAWYTPGSQGPAMDALVEAFKMGGGRARMDSFYRTNITANALKALRSGNPLGAIWRAPGVLIEQSVKPVLEWLVPRQKMGIAAKMLEYEIKRNPNISYEELQSASAKIVDSVDNRMGQLVYDNLFWNKVAKDIGMASVRSLGWNIGTWRELGGAGIDTAVQLKRLAAGKGLDGLSHRQAYAIALPAVVGILGATYQYLATGKHPGQREDGTFGSTSDSLVDLYYPQTGELDEKGRPERVALPSYMKDLYHYGTDPKQTILNKVHPAIAGASQMLQNKDFFGTEIFHPGDDLSKHLISAGKFGVEQMTPFAIRNIKRQTDLGMSAGQASLSQIGITPAPAGINKTAAEKAADEIIEANMPKGARTREAFESAKLAAKLRRELRLGKPDADQKIDDAFNNSGISKNQLLNIYHSLGSTPLEMAVRGFNAEQLQKVLEVATPEEKSRLEAMAGRKQAGQIKNWPNKQQ